MSPTIRFSSCLNRRISRSEHLLHLALVIVAHLMKSLDNEQYNLRQHSIYFLWDDVLIGEVGTTHVHLPEQVSYLVLFLHNCTSFTVLSMDGQFSF
jgi:hypothetical protein